MSSWSPKNVALIAVPLLVACGLLGAIAAGVLYADDDDDEPVATVPVYTDEAGAAPDAADQGVVDSDDRPLTNAELRRVQRAALAIVGAGAVADVDRSDDLGEAYEVEVLTDRGEIDVALDRNLKRVPNQPYDD
jgi:hypothetical protein